MIIKQELVKKIKSFFNLNIYETKVWLALLAKGIASAGEIAEISGVPRSRTYDVLESLEKQGFAIAKIGKPVKYLAVKPVAILEKLKNNALHNATEKVEILAQLKETKEYAELEELYKTGITPIRHEEMNMLKKTLKILLIIGHSLSFPSFIFAETIVFKSGQTVDTKIIERTDKYIRVDVDGSGTVLRYPLEQIESIAGEKIVAKEKKISLDKEVVALNGKSLKNILNFAYYPAAGENNKYYKLDGILFEIEGDVLKTVSTDRRRLAIAQTKLINSNSNTKKFFLSLRDIDALRNVLKDGGDVVSFSFNAQSNKVIINIGSSVLEFSLNKGEDFPDYSLVIPRYFNFITINKKEFLSALPEPYNYVSKYKPKILLRLTENKLCILNTKGGEIKRIKINFTGKKLDIAFNLLYLLETIENLPAEVSEMNFSITGENEPGAIYAEDYKCIILPIRMIGDK